MGVVDDLLSDKDVYPEAKFGGGSYLEGVNALALGRHGVHKMHL
jgi:hypothetical protein